MSLLPASSTKLEVDIANMFVNYTDNLLKVQRNTDGTPVVPARVMWNIDRCASEFLPYLALALGIDLNVLKFSDDQIRNILKISFEIHRLKGTVGSIVKLVEGLGYTVTKIDEGDRDVNAELGDWALYRVHITSPVPLVLGPPLTALIKQYAPVRSKLVSVDYTTGQTHAYNGEITYDGTYPYGAIPGSNP